MVRGGASPRRLHGHADEAHCTRRLLRDERIQAEKAAAAAGVYHLKRTGISPELLSRVRRWYNSCVLQPGSDERASHVENPSRVVDSVLWQTKVTMCTHSAGVLFTHMAGTCVGTALSSTKTATRAVRWPHEDKFYRRKEGGSQSRSDSTVLRCYSATHQVPPCGRKTFSSGQPFFHLNFHLESSCSEFPLAATTSQKPSKPFDCCINIPTVTVAFNRESPETGNTRADMRTCNM